MLLTKDVRGPYLSDVIVAAVIVVDVAMLMLVIVALVVGWVGCVQ